MLGGAKLTDIFLAEKNLVDFVDKNLGQEMDRLLEDDFEIMNVCYHLVGGLLDYPVKISHDFCDITTCWDIYVLALTKETNDNILKKYGLGIKFPGIPDKMDKNPRLAKMPFRGDELSRKQFLNAIVAACPKIKNHIVACVKEVLQTGRLDNLYIIISNVVVIRNYLWVFQEVFDPNSESKIKLEYKTYCELVEIISEQMLQVQFNLLTTFVFHDESSQNWKSFQPYFEGERCSPTIQMWAYFLQCLQRDMWSILSPQLAQRILAIILNDSLGIFVSRYCKLSPSETNIPHFVADIINILATVEKFLFYVTSDMASLCGQAEPSTSKVIFSIHVKCHCLASSLVIVGCPLEIMYKSMRHGITSSRLFESRNIDPGKFSKPIWIEVLQTLCPTFYPAPDLSYPDWELLMHLKLLCAQPIYNWPLVYKVLTMNDCKIANLILSLFPTLVTPSTNSTNFLIEGIGFKRCGGSSCMSIDCHALPKSITNSAVVSCTLYILAHGLPKETLPSVYRSIFPRFNSTDWTIMDKTQIWNNKGRPVWFQSLIDILGPIIKLSVQSLCLDILQSHWKSENSNLSTSKLNLDEDSSTQLVIDLLNSLTDTISLIPKGFFMVAEEMDDLVPVTLSPVRNNVSVHFLVSSLYSLLSIGSGIIAGFPLEVYYDQAKRDSDEGSTISKEKRPANFQIESLLDPIILATAERICHLDDPIFDQAVHRMVSQIESMMKQTHVQDKKKKHVEIADDFLMDMDISNLKSDYLMEEVEGQISLRVLYYFILTHGDVLENLIAGDVNSFKLPLSSGHQKQHDRRKSQMGFTSNSFENNSEEELIKIEFKSSKQPIVFERGPKMDFNLLKIAPRIRTYTMPSNPFLDFHYINKYRTFDEIIWIKNELNWVKIVKHCRMGLHKSFVSKQLEKRWEFQQSLLQQQQSGEEASSSSSSKQNRRNKLIDEIKALIMT